MKIAIVGLSGVGTSSVSKKLADILGWSPENIFSIGDEFRKRAAERKLELTDLREAAISGTSRIDDEIDGRAIKFFKDNKNCIVEGRLAAFHSPEGTIRILLICSETRGDSRFVRILKRETTGQKYSSFTEAHFETIRREEEDRARYLKIYGPQAMNFDDPRNFTFSPFDTSGKSTEETVELVKAAIESLKSLS